MADRVRRIARAYYERASDEEKNEAELFFRKLGPSGDRKIRVKEFKKGVQSRLSDESDRVFKELDSDSDGALDFHDVLVLFYHNKNAISIFGCDGCRKLIFGPYFSCFKCLCNKCPQTYDLCCDCYGKGKFEHKGPLTNLLHGQVRLAKYGQLPANYLKTPAKEMEQLREVAISHYQAGWEDVQAKAYDFFKSIDSDGDGRVDLEEFLSFIGRHGYPQMRNKHFFKELDSDGNSRLGFWEVMTLYYIIKSGRPFCNCCGDFIPGIFFSCVECFDPPQNSFNICHNCYRDNKYKHDIHNGRTLFLDNGTLLMQTKRDPASGQSAAGQAIERAARGSASSSRKPAAGQAIEQAAQGSASSSRKPAAGQAIKPAARGSAAEPVSDSEFAKKVIDEAFARRLEPYGSHPTAARATVARDEATVPIPRTIVRAPTPATTLNLPSQPPSSSAISTADIAFKALEAALAAINVGTTIMACTIL